MNDINSVVLIGRIGSVLRFAKSVSGTPYTYFAMEIEDKTNAKEEKDYNYHQIVHIMCFKKRIIDYLQAVDVRQREKVVVVGFISSYASELKGEKIISTVVCARDILVVKTPNK